jgi:hypothetical protein
MGNILPINFHKMGMVLKEKSDGKAEKKVEGDEEGKER